MPKDTETRLQVARLNPRNPVDFALAPDAEARAALAASLEILGIRKLRFDGTLRAEGRDAWRLEGTLGATVVQACGITLDPVVTRIDTTVSRYFVPEHTIPAPKGESEMPVDDSVDPLGTEIDLAAIMEEALTLALPAFPRAEGAHLEPQGARPPNAAPIEDTRPNPFAALAGLREKLDKDDNSG